MRLSIAYPELSKEIDKRFGHKIVFEYVSSDTIKVSKEISLPFFGSTKLGLELKVLGFDDTTLKLKTASDVLSKLLSLMPSLDITKYAVIEKDTISLFLGNIEELRQVFQYIRPTALNFSETQVNLDMVSL